MPEVHHAFIDESARGARYYVCAAVTSAATATAVRQLARGLQLPGQTSIHFYKERASRRRQILDAVINSGLVRSQVCFSVGDEALLRPRCLAALARALTAAGTDRVVIESRAGRDQLDIHTLDREAPPATRSFRYAHAPRRSEPGLWLADALAWSYGAGGEWRTRVAPLIDAAVDVGRPR